MLTTRVIVALTIIDDGLYRTKRFKKPSYVGDPLNAIRIFNDKEVDELILLDISPTRKISPEKFDFYAKIASQAFMPVSFGGGLTSLEQMKILFSSGFDKVVLNSAAVNNPKLLSDAAELYGSQSVAVSIDYGRSLFGRRRVLTDLGRQRTGLAPVPHAAKCEELGAGELLVRSVDHDGLMQGYDLDILQEVAGAVSVPVVAVGGAGSIEHMVEATNAGAQSVCAGSMFVYHGKNRAVLITYPNSKLLDERLGRHWA